MPYIGNTIRAADDYRLIDDISSGFNGSATSFALQVAGSAPVPFPKSPQQVLISVNGVIQEPDPTGASGFNLVGTNIVFSSAPTNGHAFFGIIYATADYLNAGGNFPSGSLGAPSFTFIGDENTGYYRKGGGSVGFVSDATEIANFDSNGITISSGNLIIPDKIIHNGDTNTAIRFPTADTVTVETGGGERLRVTSAGRLGLGNDSPDARFSVKDTSTFTAYASSVPSVGACMQQLQNSPSSEAINNHSSIQFGVNGGTHNRVNSISAVAESASNRKLAFTFCTDSGSNRNERLRISADGHVVPGADSTYNIGANANRFANGYFDTLYGDGSNLTGISGTTINNNANNRLITGSGTANTLEGESELTFDGNSLVLANSTGNIKTERHGGGANFTLHGSADSGNTATGNNDDIGNIVWQTADGTDRNNVVAYMTARGAGAFSNSSHPTQLEFWTTADSSTTTTKRVIITKSGHLIPAASNTYDLGDSSTTWRNIYTNDLHLSNEGSQNDVDSTWGSYTIQEGFNDLFLINNRTGKKYKFNLTEVN